MEIEPGEVFKVKETTHGVNNVVEFVAEAILNCSTSEVILPSNMLLWWDSSISSSITFGIGSSVASIADQSGHGNDGVPSPIFTQQPDYSATGLNGRPTLVYVNFNQALVCDPLAFGTGSTLTCWYVGYFASSSHPDARAISYAASGQSFDFDNLQSFAVDRATTTDSVGISRNSNAQISSIAAGYDTPHRTIATIAADGTLSIYVNGTTASSSHTGGAFGTNGTFAVGNTGYGGFLGQGYWHGGISEVGVSTDASSPAQVAVLDDYLATKWGF